MVPDEESLTSAVGGKRKEGKGEMGKQCLLQSEIKKDHAHWSVHGPFFLLF